jgi:hypothetical protein
VLLFVLPLLLGCERGCLSRWLAERGMGPPPPTTSRSGPPPGIDLGGSDCSDGLLRCVEGRVEASRTAHLPSECGGAKPGPQGESPRACVCPFDVIGSCASGCAAEGLEVVGAPTEAGVAQLCQADAPVARPLTPGEVADSAPAICAAEGVACVDGIVRICDHAGQSARPIAKCFGACQTAVAIDDATVLTTHGSFGAANPPDPGAARNPDGFVSILCMHGHAERR